MRDDAKSGARYTAFHWGTYRTLTAPDGSVALEPLADDAAPSALGPTMVGSLRDPCRIDQPHARAGWLDARRTGRPSGEGRGREPFVPLDWDEALDLVAGELTRTIAEHGNSAIFAGSYGWGSAGRFHHPQSQLHRFMNCIGGYTASVNAYSFAAAEVVVPHIVGHALRPLHAMQTPLALIAEHVELVVAFGGMLARNAEVSPGGAGPHILPATLARCAARGVRFVNVSPARDDLPESVEPEWLPLRPGTDVALMLGLAHVLLDEDLCDHGFLARCTVGFPTFARTLDGRADGVVKTPEWAEAITQIPAGTIRALARRMAGARTLIALSWSIQRGDHGEQPIWAGIALAAMLGQIGLPGGGFGIGYGGCNYIGNAARKIPWPALKQGVNPVPDFIPVARFTDMLLDPGGSVDYDGRRLTYPNVDLVYWAGGNPFHHQQDINRLRRAWARPRTIIVNEPWWNATARRADIVLPVTTPLERDDVAALMGEPVVVAMRRALKPYAKTRSDFAIFGGLAARLNVQDAFTEGRDEPAWIEHLYAGFREAAAQAGVTMPDFARFWEDGLFRLPEPETMPVLFADFHRDPEAHPLPTPSGLIEIASELVADFRYADCPGHPVWLEPAERLGTSAAERYPLHLISGQPPGRLHSQHDHAPLSRASKVAGREPIALNSADAATRGIRAGDVVRVMNARGTCLAGAVLTESLRPGVVRLATGAWYDPIDASDDALDAHGNPNVLTLDKGTSCLAQGPIAMTTLVEVERWVESLPEISIWAPPTVRVATPDA